MWVLEDSLSGRQEKETQHTKRQADLVRDFCRDPGERKCSLLGWQQKRERESLGNI